jgi:hypothetical protein
MFYSLQQLFFTDPYNFLRGYRPNENGDVTRLVNIGLLHKYINRSLIEKETFTGFIKTIKNTLPYVEEIKKTLPYVEDNSAAKTESTHSLIDDNSKKVGNKRSIELLALQQGAQTSLFMQSVLNLPSDGGEFCEVM